MDNKEYRLVPDVANMKDEIIKLAETILTDISEDSLNYFSEEAKRAAESTLEKYVFSVYDLYTKGALKISDNEKLTSFLDFSNGYQSLMLSWKKNHPIEVVQRTIEINEPQAEPSSIKSYHKQTAVVGTIIATALAIFSKLWIGLAVEILTLTSSTLQYKNYKTNKESYEAKIRQYEIELKSKKQLFINGIIDDLCKWINMGVEKSNEILKTFNL